MVEKEGKPIVSMWKDTSCVRTAATFIRKWKMSITVEYVEKN
jgi:hypothetical protein